MPVTVYRSSDVGAPVLTGLVGSLVTVLDGCLVNGYGDKSAAGWAKEFTGANKGVYRAATGNRLRFRVDDSFGAEARVIGYEVMTTVDAGTNPFPTTAQVNGGFYVYKSNSANATARPWVIVASDRAFFLLPDANGVNWLIEPGSSGISGQTFFGEFNSYKSGDLYNTMIIGAESSGTNNCRLPYILTSSSTHSNTSGHYIARSYLNTGTSVQCAKRAVMDVTSCPIIGANSGYYPQFPDPITGSMMISPIFIIESTSPGSQSGIRGMMPGLWAPLHSSPAAHGDTILGSGNTAGKEFLLFQTALSTSLGRGLLEISNTW